MTNSQGISSSFNTKRITLRIQQTQSLIVTDTKDISMTLINIIQRNRM